MAGQSSVLTDGSWLSRLDRLLFKLESLLSLVGGLAVFSLMILAVISVGGRNFTGSPIPGYVDWIEQIMPLIAFLGIAYAQRTGGHIRMDILISRLKGRALWMVELISVILMFLLMLILVYGSYTHFERSFDFAAPLWSRDSSMDIAIPLWPVKLIIPVAFSILSLRLMLQIWGYMRAFIRNDTRPVAVPLIEDAATQAANEACNYSASESGEKQ
ncbi:MAG: C4-dicarboxylate ABC transporter permease [uncultured Thiotrichaceae bacterium]|uniref:TRAP transporter small permease protein n=1 Tax=uncultured Thiotrichaceae bacterium TaxID=298394 RepID=A0A6S6UG69_9GAMM|nr:MAG: C4-dicarboxylate ABC transporter permease [uncultured Thiotrichaceae bacterium]